MRLLVVAQEPIDARAVRSALPGEELDGAEVMVVSPAVEQSGLKFLMSDVDDAIIDAEKTADETVASLRSDGVHARGGSGESEPLLAINDALATFKADRIVVFGDEELARQARERYTDVRVDSV